MDFPIGDVGVFCGDERVGGRELAEASVYHFWLGVVCNYFVAGDWIDSDE